VTIYSLDVLLFQFGTSSTPFVTVASWLAHRFLMRQARQSGSPISSRIFHSFFVIYTVNGFSIVNEAGVDVFLYSLAFSMIQQMLAICSLVPLPFLNPACTPGSSQFTYCWSLAWRILSITLLACEMNVVVWTFFGISLFGIGMKTDFSQSCGHCWFFQCCWHTEYSAVTESSFRIWNSSAGILSPPLALFIVMLPNSA